MNNFFKRWWQLLKRGNRKALTNDYIAVDSTIGNTISYLYSDNDRDTGATSEVKVFEGFNNADFGGAIGGDSWGDSSSDSGDSGGDGGGDGGGD